MGDLDEMSRAIGRIEGQVEQLLESHKAQWTKLEDIEKTLTRHRLKTAGIAATVVAGVETLYHYLKGGH